MSLFGLTVGRVYVVLLALLALAVVVFASTPWGLAVALAVLLVVGYLVFVAGWRLDRRIRKPPRRGGEE